MEFTKIKILYLIDILANFGGAEKNFSHVITHIDKRRFIPIPVCLRMLGLPDEFRKNDIHPIVLGVDRLYNFNGLESIFLLYKLIRKEKIDLIVTYFETSDYISALLHLITQVLLIINRRDMGYRYNGRQRLLNRIVSRICNKIIAVSQSVASRAQTREKPPTDELILIYTG